MTAETKNRPRRVLVVDDDRAIHEMFNEFFPNSKAGHALENQESVHSDKTSRSHDDPHFELDSAFQGEEALQTLVDAWAEGKPFLTAFVSMNMSSGWDGVETTSRLWKVDPFLHVVICTTRFEYQWNDIVDRLGRTERLLILTKPLEAIEVKQAALMLTERWNASLQEWCRLTEAQQEASDARRAMMAAKRRIDEAVGEWQFSGKIPPMGISDHGK